MEIFRAALREDGHLRFPAGGPNVRTFAGTEADKVLSDSLGLSLEEIQAMFFTANLFYPNRDGKAIHIFWPEKGFELTVNHDASSSPSILLQGPGVKLLRIPTQSSLYK